ncbi:DUF4834 family protein [Dysgonomonas sp. 216]|uniref:DUF4834 family protein n=1 Tax=Dysgonomonas sp. 216 TaxID=2302934 RepID=UPI0013D1D5CD|nr:DUF4834 family protein [Dysgonomonas sp. 216]NDW17465.1 DUF4834 family protein [Dysgonomonas sp. 216]
MSFLIYLVLFILAIVLIPVLLLGLPLIRLYLKARYGKGGNMFNTSNSKQSSRQNTTNTNSAANKKKVFGKDEGEYVEFEEIE